RTPRDEGPKDQIAQRLVLGDDLAQPFHRNLDHLPSVTDDSGEVEALAGEQSELAKEAVPHMDGYEPVFLAETLNDCHGSRLDDEEVAARVSGGKQNLAGLDRAQAAQLAQSRPLIVVESRERAVAVDGLWGPGSDLVHGLLHLPVSA